LRADDLVGRYAAAGRRVEPTGCKSMSLPLFSNLALPSRAQAQAAQLKQSLSQARAELKASYANGARPRTPLTDQCRLVDDTLRRLWRGAHMPRAAALLAVGGYGRGELYPYSDVDLLVLLPTRADAEATAKIEEFVSMLWDIGFALGHSVRTVAECVE